MMAAMGETLELAIEKAASSRKRPRSSLAGSCLSGSARWRGYARDIEIGFGELDDGVAELVDIEDAIAQARKKHGAS
jgi:hypothetical protein